MSRDAEKTDRGNGWISLDDCLKSVRRAVSAHLGRQHSAADLVQEAYARMLDRPGQARLGNLAGYLYRTAINLAYNASVRNSVETRVYQEVALNQETASLAQDPARIYADRRQLAEVMEVIDSLPPRCREVFLLYRFEGLDQGEIASRLGISRNMVEKHVIRAMRACRAALNP